jgi:hypothetical protein
MSRSDSSADISAGICFRLRKIGRRGSSRRHCPAFALPAAERRRSLVSTPSTPGILVVIFVLFPIVIWTGLAMSPALEGAFPIGVILLGGRQTARTLHFFISIALVLFLLVHVLMVFVAGFRKRWAP